MPKTLIARLDKIEADHQLKEQTILELEHLIIEQNEQIKTQASFYKQQLVAHSAQLQQIRQVLIERGIQLDEDNSIPIPREFQTRLPFTPEDILQGISKLDYLVKLSIF